MSSVITIDGREFKRADEVVVAYPGLFVGCGGRNLRKIPEKKEVPADHYLYAKEKGDGWVASTEKYSRAKLLLSCEWLNQLLEDREDEETCRETPKEIQLDQDDLFRDNEGNLFKIHMVGERAKERCFFRVKDVSDCFDIPRLSSTLVHSNSSYARGDDFTTFKYVNYASGGESKNMYLTFRGLMKVLFTSRCGNASKFIDWCLDCLFKATFGEEEEKQELSAELLSIDVRNLRAMLDRSAAAVPAIYLFSLKKRGENIYKFGCTNDLKRRSKEHFKKYEDIELVCFSYTDPKYMFEAESMVKNLCCRLGRFIEKEIVEIDPKDMKLIKQNFSSAASRFSGNTADLQKELQEVTRQNELLRTEKEKCMLEIQMMKERHKLEMDNLKLSKDLEIAKLKLSSSDS